MEKIEEIEQHQQRSTKRQVLLCLTAYLTAIAPSMSIGFSAVSLPSLTDPDNSRHLTIYEASWVASIASIGTPIGCLLCGPLSDHYGRRTTLLLVNITAFLGWATIALAATSPALYTQLLIGRFITGLSTGLIAMPATVYMAETSSNAHRLYFTTASAVAFSAGILGVYVLGYTMPARWGVVALISAVIACASMICGVFFLPESPVWLIKRNMMHEAKESLRRIYGRRIIDDDLIMIRNNAIKTNTGRTPRGFMYHLRKKWLNLSKPECIRPLIIMTGYFFFQQFSGTFVIIFYAVKIVEITGGNIDPYAGTLLIGIARFISAIITCAVANKYGQRAPSLFSGVGMTCAMLSLALYTHLRANRTLSADYYGFIPMVCLIVYFCVSTPGFVTVPFAMSAEVFPVGGRGVASGLVATTAYIFNFIAVKSFDAVVEGIGACALFACFGGVSCAGTVFVYRWLPETKGKSMAEIEEGFKSGGVVDDKVPLNV